MNNQLGRMARNHFRKHLNTYRELQEEIRANVWEWWFY